MGEEVVLENPGVIDFILSPSLVPVLSALAGGLFTLLITTATQRAETRRSRMQIAHQMRSQRADIKLKVFSEYINTIGDFVSGISELAMISKNADSSSEYEERVQKFELDAIKLQMSPMILLLNEDSTIQIFNNFTGQARLAVKIFNGTLEPEDLWSHDDGLPISEIVNKTAEILGKDELAAMSKDDLGDFIESDSRFREVVRDVVLDRGLEVARRVGETRDKMLATMRDDLALDFEVKAESKL